MLFTFLNLFQPPTLCGTLEPPLNIISRWELCMYIHMYICSYQTKRSIFESHD